MEDFARRKDIPALKKIWAACFGGEREYADFYYRTRFRPKETLVWRENGLPVSMMTLMPLTIAGQTGAYIYAVATLPEYRGRGLVRKLSAFAENVLRQQGRTFMALVPAEPSLFAFYEKLGYRTSFFLWEKELSCPEGGRARTSFARCPFGKFAKLRAEYLSGFPGGAAHPKGELRYIYKELCRYNGGVFTFLEDGAEEYAAFTRTEGGLWLRECSAKDPLPIAEALLFQTGLHKARICCGWEFPGASRIPYGMGKALLPDGNTGPLEQLFSPPFYMSLMLE